MQVRSNIKNIYTFIQEKYYLDKNFSLYTFLFREGKIFLPENFIPGHCNFCCDHCKIEWIEIKMNKITFNSSGVKMFMKEKVKVRASAGCCVYNIGHNTSVCKGFTSLCLFQLIWCFDCCGIMFKKNIIIIILIICFIVHPYKIYKALIQRTFWFLFA